MEDDRKAVGRFVALARERLGTGQTLAEAISPWLAKPTGRSTVDAWARGENDPPAWLLFRMAREWQLSLDRFAHVETADQDLREEVRLLRGRIAVIQERLQDLLALQGQKPMEFPDLPREASGE